MAQFDLAHGCFRKKISRFRQFLTLLGSHVVERGLCTFDEFSGVLKHIAGIGNGQTSQDFHHASAEFGALTAFGKRDSLRNGAITRLDCHTGALGGYPNLLGKDSRRLSGGNMAKGNHLAARNYGGKHAFAGTTQKNEHHTRHRLFKSLQKSIRRLSS